MMCSADYQSIIVNCTLHSFKSKENIVIMQQKIIKAQQRQNK